MGKLELYIPVGRERLRCGYTTGTCAAAAAAGAAALLLEGAALPAVHIDTPAGVRVEAELLEHAAGEGWAACAVRKDGGDDPDVTDGALICARVERSTGPGHPARSRPAGGGGGLQLLLDHAAGCGR